MKILILILIGLVVSFIYTDLKSDSALTNIVAPLGILVFLISLAIWLVMLFHKKGIDQNTSPGGIDSGGFGDSGGGDWQAA